MTHRNNELKMLLARLYEERLKGEIADDTFLILANEFKGERERNLRHSQKLQETIQQNQYLKLSMDNFIEVVRENKKIEQLTRELLYQTVERIDVYPRVKSGKEYTQRIDVFFYHFGTLESLKKGDY